MKKYSVATTLLLVTGCFVEVEANNEGEAKAEALKQIREDPLKFNWTIDVEEMIEEAVKSDDSLSVDEVEEVDD